MNSKKAPLKKDTPWTWVPSLYFAEGIPYIMVMSISVIMYKRLGLSNEDIAFYTCWLYLPWVIKPLWSPIVDMFKTKRWWIVSMEFAVGVTLAGVALTIQAPHFVQYTLALFWLMAFSSATHDIAADGFYMIGLDTNRQSLFVGIRSTFYRISMIAGQGLTLIMAGMLETSTGNTTQAWSLTMAAVAVLFAALFVYHAIFLPKAEDSPATSARRNVFLDFAVTFRDFFARKEVWTAIAFMLLYRFPEALLVKIAPLFLVDSTEAGGLALSTEAVGVAQGTVGVIGLTLGGILGGVCASRGGLKKWLWPMVWAISLPDIVYVILSFCPTQDIWTVSTAICIEQFGYGFGFTAYMLFMLYFCQGRNKTSHYAICTGFMALSMMLPGMFAGKLQEYLGYTPFFMLVTVCTLITFAVSAFIKIDPKFGIKTSA